MASPPVKYKMPRVLDADIAAQWREAAQPLLIEQELQALPMTMVAFFHSRLRGFVGTSLTFADGHASVLLLSMVHQGTASSLYLVATYSTCCMQLRRKYEGPIEQFTYVRSLADRVYRALGDGGIIPDPAAMANPNYQRMPGRL